FHAKPYTGTAMQVKREVRLTCLKAGRYGTNQNRLSTKKNNCNFFKHAILYSMLVPFFSKVDFRERK
ncbi:MAG: hypothetical protein ACTTIO_07075, partial [Candidatus Fimenecus sp.]